MFRGFPWSSLIGPQRLPELLKGAKGKGTGASEVGLLVLRVLFPERPGPEDHRPECPSMFSPPVQTTVPPVLLTDSTWAVETQG